MGDRLRQKEWFCQAHNARHRAADDELKALCHPVPFMSAASALPGMAP